MKVQTNGIYVSEPGFEKYDMTLYWYFLRFFESGEVKKGFSLEQPLVLELYETDKYYGSGQYSVFGNTVKFSISEKGYTSNWRGIVNDENIEFTVSEPDFEDFGGTFKFLKLP